MYRRTLQDVADAVELLPGDECGIDPDTGFYNICNQKSGTFDKVAIELCGYFILLTICMFYLLDQVRGKPKKLENWLYFRKLSIYKDTDRNSVKVADSLKLILYFYIAAPFLALFGWTALLLYSNAQDGFPPWSGICVGLLGSTMLLFGWNVLQVKWSNYRFKPRNILNLMICLLLVTSYEFLVVFGYDHIDRFLPFSAVFLNLNVSILAIVIFLAKYKNQKGVNDMVKKFFPETAISLDRMRDDNMEEEIQAQAKDPNWKQSFEDLADILTVAYVSGEKFGSIIGDGFLEKFKKLKKAKQNICYGVALFLAFLLLIGYAVVLWIVDNSSMGILTTISITLMDIFNLMLYNSGNVKTPSQIIILLILNRALMVGLGRNFWIYGYFFLYLIYSLVFVFQIARNRYPLEGDIVLKSAKIGNMLKSAQTKLSKDEAGKLLKKGFNNPEFLFFLLSLLFFILMIIVKFVDLKQFGIIIAPFTIVWTSYNKKTKLVEVNPTIIDYPAVGGLSIFLIGSFYTMVALFRLSARKITGADKYDSNKSVFGKFKYIGPMGIFNILCFLCFTIWGVLAHQLTKKAYLISLMALGSMGLLAFARGFMFFILNDFDYFQDVKKLNKKIDRHNKNIEAVENKEAAIQAQIVSGEFKLPSLKDRAKLLNEANQPVRPQPQPIVQPVPATPVPQPKLPTNEEDHTVLGVDDPVAPVGGGDGPMVPSQVPEDEKVPEPQPQPVVDEGAAEQARIDAEAHQRQQEAEIEAREQAMMQQMIQKQQEKKQKEEEARQKALNENAELRQKEEADRRKMEEQLILEKQRKKEQQEAAEAKRLKIVEVNAKKQREAEKKRLEAERNKPPVVQTQDNDYNFSGQMQSAEVNVRNKGFKEDEIYEGGENGEDADAPVNQTTVPLKPPTEQKSDDTQYYDPSKEWINQDDYEDAPGGPQKIARTRLKRINDGRLIHKDSWMAAYRAGDLRPYDYQILHSFAFSVFILLILIAVLYLQMDDLIAVMIVIPVFYLFVSLLIGSTVIYQSRSFTKKETVYWTVVNVLYIGAGCAYFVWKYNFADFVYDLEKRERSQMEASKFVFCYILLVPLVVHCIVVTLRLTDRGLEGFTQAFKVMTGVIVFLLVLMIVSVFFFVHYIEGIICVCALGVMTYVAWQFMLYFKNEMKMKPKFKLINGMLAILCIAAASVYAGIQDDMSSYSGATISCFAWLFFLWCFAIFQFTIDSNSFVYKPIYFSPTLFPIYKYNPKTNDLEDHYAPTIAWISGLVLLLFWGFFSNYQLNPEWFGVIVVIGIQQLVLVTMISTRQMTTDSMDDAFEFIDQRTVKKAWIETKLSYIKDKGAYSRIDLLTYRRAWVRRFFLNSYIATLKGKIHKPPTKLRKVIAQEVECTTEDKLAFYKEKINGFVDFKEFNPAKIGDMAYLAHMYDMIVHESYLDELQQLLQFIIISVQNSNLLQQKMKKDFIRFLNLKLDVLNALGISIQVPNKGSIDSRMEQVNAQVEELSDDQKVIFKQLELMYEIESRQGQDSANAVHLADLQVQNQRDMDAEEQQKIKQEQLAQLQLQIEQNQQEGKDVVDIDMDIDNMPDCRLKYQIILKRSKMTEGPHANYKFTDTQFPANDESIGEVVMEKLYGSENVTWPRVSETQSPDGVGYAMFQDGVDENDIMQGTLGDCYFLSALSTLSSDDVRDKFIYEVDDEFEQCGAFCVKFYNSGKEDIVIIDDMFPYNPNSDEFHFVKSRVGNELWPMILEKAYAKWFGSFSKIETGWISNALADLTGGIPEEHTKEDNENIQKFWDKMIDWQKQGAYLGGSSNSHENGDKQISPDGIAQGHAYSILKLVEVDKVKLMKLRNPHGELEWSGDWSDDSELWTTRMRNILDFHTIENDGIFWMDFNDFLYEFKAVHVCRGLSEKNGWHQLNIHDEWVGKYACGLPSKKNRGAKMKDAPQYSITIHKPGKGFLVLRLIDKISSVQSVQAGYLSLQSVDGDLIAAPNKRATLGALGPKKLALQSLEVDFKPSLTYPYNFTCIITNMNSGEEGHGKYGLQVFSKDSLMGIKKMN